MVRRRRATNRRRRRGARRIRAMPTAPPRLLITSNTRRINLSYGVTITDNAKRLDIKFSDVFSQGPNSGIPFQYREGKILSVRVFWQSDNATSDAGSVCLNVEDYGENTGTDTCEFYELMSYPGSMTRKVWQNVSNRWFPTEPSDRDYRDLLGIDGILTVTVRHSIEGSKLKGRVICLITLSVRGKSTKRCAAAAQLIQQMYMSDHFQDMVVVEPTGNDDPK